jgi:zinc protease
MVGQATFRYRLFDQGCKLASGEAVVIRLVASLFCIAATLGVDTSSAMTIEQIVSPSGIEAWLVQDKALPLVTLHFAFLGGSTQDEADKAGTANLAAHLLDEGAGDLDGKSYQKRLKKYAIKLEFQVGRDYIMGSLRSLNEHGDEAFELLRLALASPRFDADAIERTRGQVLANLQRSTLDPSILADGRWWQSAFPNHPYGREREGTLETVPRIGAEDLRDYVRRVFARDELKISIVGDVDAKTAGALIDRAFSGLPAKSDLKPVANAPLSGLGRRIVIDVDLPQTAVTFGGQGIFRHDPEFLAAFIVNHILGGGALSRLYREVRDTRGLAYSVYDTLISFRHAAVTLGGTATQADRTADALALIEQEVKRMADEGPTPNELGDAKSFLKDSFPLSFDSSDKIAAKLTDFQIEDTGIDYIQRRPALLDAVTTEDAKRAAKRLYGGGLLVTIVGRPKGLTSSGTTAR